MLVLSLLVLTAGLTLAYEEYDINQAESLFEQFIQEYNKVYKDDQEKQMRFNIFKEKLNKINEQNKQHGYNVMGVNLFADISKEEFASKYLGYVPKGDDDVHCPTPSQFLKTSPGDLPEHFDWRDKGVINKVTDQGDCGSCWAFSVISNVESHHAIKYGADKLIKLSEQQVIDCDNVDGACRGGDIPTGIYYIKDQGGVMSIADYPSTSDSTGEKSDCKFNQSLVKVQVTGCVDYTNTTEEDIKAVLVNHGPLSIAIAGNPIQDYNSGVFEDCDEDEEINHALLLVGYGTDEDTKKPYWLIRNSWADSWGEHGYIRIIRGKPACLIGKCDLIAAEVA